MLTGDNEGTARAIAEEVGVDADRAGLLPEQKVEAVEQLQGTYDTVGDMGMSLGVTGNAMRLANLDPDQ